MGVVVPWEREFAALEVRLAARFSRGEPRRRALTYLRGLLGMAARKNGWPLAEAAGDATPYGMQRALSGSVWDAEAVRDDLRDGMVEALGHPDAVAVTDETGFLKKGPHAVGVQRHYRGTAGRIENSQIGVFLAYASPRGQAFLDRELYLPESWAGDAAQRRAAGVPETVTFKTKPQRAKVMQSRALTAQVPMRWLTGKSLRQRSPLQALAGGAGRPLCPADLGGSRSPS